jgi:hypothetical protein
MEVLLRGGFDQQRIDITLHTTQVSTAYTEIQVTYHIFLI